MDDLKNLLQIIDENSKVSEQRPTDSDYEIMGNPPGDPTYTTDPKTGNLIPDIDPTLRPNAPTGPIPGTRPGPGITAPPPTGGAKPPPPTPPKPSTGTVRPPSTQNRMPSVPGPGQAVKKVTEKTLGEAVNKIIELIQRHDRVNQKQGVAEGQSPTYSSRADAFEALKLPNADRIFYQYVHMTPENWKNEYPTSLSDNEIATLVNWQEHWAARGTPNKDELKGRILHALNIIDPALFGGKQGVREGSEESSQDRMSREMQAVIDRVKARGMAADRARGIKPGKPKTVEDLEKQIATVQQTIAHALQLLKQKGQQYYPQDYSDRLDNPRDTLISARKELEDLRQDLEKLRASR